MDLSIMKTVKEYLICDELIKADFMECELINEVNPYLFLRIEDSFIYVDEYLKTDFLILEYLDNKERTLKKEIYNENESKESLKNLQYFKSKIYKILKKDDYYQVLFIKIAI